MYLGLSDHAPPLKKNPTANSCLRRCPILSDLFLFSPLCKAAPSKLRPAPTSAGKLCSATVVQPLSHVGLFATPWTAACQASLSVTISQGPLGGGHHQPCHRTARWAARKLENNYTREVLEVMQRVWAGQQISQRRDPARGLGPPGESDCEGQRDLITEFHRLGRQTLGGHKQT